MSPALWPLAALAGAFAIDLVFGDPPNRWHPVAWLGALLGTARRRFARGSAPALLWSGAAATTGVAGLAASAAVLVSSLAMTLGPVGFVLEALALSTCLSVRGLFCAAREVATSLEARDLPAARAALAWHLVSRPTGDLAEGEIAAAAVESVAENLTDSIVAPVLVYLGFGLAGAAFYRAVNTADAMLGYRDGPLEYFGKLAARADDVLNLLPARVAALGIVGAAVLTGEAPGGALATMWRDHRQTASPNAGWTMAAMAGALGVRLVKRGAYVLGEGPLPTAAHVRRSLIVIAVASALVIALGIALALLWK